MNVDAELAAFAGIFPQIDFADVDDARSVVREFTDRMMDTSADWPDGVSVHDHVLPTTDGTAVNIRVFMPPATSTPPPVLLYLHAGGFVLGDFETDSRSAVRFCLPTNAAVVHVDYRLAPEHRFPAALQDCYAALTWTVDSAQMLGVDASRLAVVGVSAGGALAAGVCLMARDLAGPEIAVQLLTYPVLDDRLQTTSSTSFPDTPGWNSHNNALMWTLYRPEAISESSALAAYFAPFRTADLSGLPPSYVLTCEYDPLRDEGLQYGQRLLEAGVPAEVHNFPGTYHGFDQLPTAISGRAWDEEIGVLRRALST